MGYMVDCDGDLKELLATARAIYFAYQQGAITQKQAKERSEPILRRLNSTIKLIAQKFKMKPKYISFQDLGRGV